MPYVDGANIARGQTDYGELHTMLVQVKPTLEHWAFDEKIIEATEVDAALTWRRKAGGTIWCEPSSVVHFVEDAPIRPADIRLFQWRWDMCRIKEAYGHFESKWGFDISEHGEFRHFLVIRNRKLGLLPRAFPSAYTLRLSRILYSGAWNVRLALALAVAPTVVTLAYEWTTGDMPSHAIRAAAGVPIGLVVAWLVVAASDNQVN